MEVRVKFARITWCVVTFAVLATACGTNSSSEADETANVRETSVSFKTSDGRTLKGRLFGSGPVGVTLAHMFPTDATSWYPSARKIAASGYMALAFDFRGFGASAGTKMIAKAPTDIEAAATFLTKRGAKDLAFIGASMGGAASIIAAAAQKPLAVVAVSAPMRFMGLDAAFSSSSVQRPVLLIGSRGDTAAFQAIEEFERALPNPDTKIYDGDAHGTNLLDARPEAVDEIVEFLKRYAPLSDEIPSPSG